MRLVFIIGLIGCLATASHAQEIMRGIVVDSATFNPLPFVTVRIKNQNKGTTTDTQGNFSITATQADTLVLSLVGYETLEVPLLGWEPSMILLPEKATMLKSITIYDLRLDDPYEGMFDEQIEQWRQQNKSLPFYYSRARKQKVRVGRLQQENLRVKTYVDVVINNPEVKATLMKKYALTEKQYYDLLAEFNSQNHLVMYYLTAGELLTLLNNFFDRHAQ